MTHQNQEKTNKAVLFLNLGTPKNATVPEVKKYLKQFLMDPFVIDIPFLFRFLLVRGIIIPFRAKKSTEAYRQIWTTEGSPLKVLSERLIEKLNNGGDSAIRYVLGMRYGKPSIERALHNIFSSPVSDLYVFPAYPQYALSSTETGLQEVKKILQHDYRDKLKTTNVHFLESYPRDSGFVSAFVKSIKKSAEEFKPDHYFFSYHGLPIRHVKKISTNCTGTGDCSQKDTLWNAKCYRRQCYQTTLAIAKALGLEANQFTMGFQSRLSNNWIQPFSDDLYKSLPKKGVKRLLVACPSFTTDCLETLEEVAIRGREEFLAHGGEDLRLAPCLNESDDWVVAVQAMVQNAKIWTELGAQPKGQPKVLVDANPKV